MKQKPLFILGLCSTIGVIILFVLYSFSPLNQTIYRANFERIFLSKSILKQKAVMNVEFNSFYFAGVTQENLYLGNSTAPLHILITNKTLTDSQHVILKTKLDTIKDIKQFRLAVDSPYFFLSHGTMPLILRGNINSWEVSKLKVDVPDYFVELVSMGESSFGMRSYSSTSGAYELGRKNLIGPVKFNYDLLQKQIDGLFCVDGELHFSKELDELVYLHYYRNEFVVANTNLDLVYRGHTIDTFSHAQIKVAEIGKGNKSMLSTIPIRINNRSCLSGKRMFVESNILAKNESMSDFENMKVIDVYNLENGTYLNSFHIPSYRNQKPMKFYSFNNHLAVLTAEYLVLFDFDDSFL